MYDTVKRRLGVLERGLKPLTAGIMTAVFKDGTRRKMLWTDAAQAALNDELADVQGDAGDELLGLVKMFME